jgi:hypothetical protein
MRKPDSIYDETVREYADYFDMPVADVHKLFNKFLSLNYDEAKAWMPPFQRALCIGLYRVTKLKGACRMAAKSREGWKDRAMDLGSPGHLVNDDA